MTPAEARQWIAQQKQTPKRTRSIGGLTRTRKVVVGRQHGEDDLQMACCQWFRLQHPGKIFLHPANGGRRSAREGARLKKMGVLPGVCDVLIPEPVSDWHGLWVELKWGKNMPTKEQKTFMQAMRDRQYTVGLCWSLEEFQIIVTAYFADQLAADRRSHEKDQL